jgi:hypothetical protein
VSHSIIGTLPLVEWFHLRDASGELVWRATGTCPFSPAVTFHSNEYVPSLAGFA